MRIDGHTASRGFDCPKCEQHVTAKDFEERVRTKYGPSSSAISDNSNGGGVGYGYYPYGGGPSPYYYYDPYSYDPYYYDYYYGWLWGYPGWYDPYYGYYPYLLANGKATLEIKLNSAGKAEFNAASSTFADIPINAESHRDGRPSADAASTSEPTGYAIRTAALSDGKEYACVISQSTGNPICDHYVDKEALVRWIQHPQRKEGDPRCPACRGMGFE